MAQTISCSGWRELGVMAEAQHVEGGGLYLPCLLRDTGKHKGLLRRGGRRKGERKGEGQGGWRAEIREKEG